VKPSIAFIIIRMNWYRVMAPVIDAALRRGWHVECWHDVGTPLPMRPQDFPSIESAPLFSSGSVKFREYCGAVELSGLVGEKLVDVVVNIIAPVNAHKVNWPSKPARSIYVCLEPSPMDILYNIIEPEALRHVDMFALTTVYWREQGLFLMKEIKRMPVSTEMEEELRAKSIIVGWPQSDQLFLIDPVEVRRRLGIPEKQPVVVYLNWADSSNLNLRMAFFSANSIRKKLGAIAQFPFQLPSVLPYLLEPNLDQVGKAIRAFCDRNGAYLLVKCRHKDKTWPIEERIADRVIYDESYYPHTIHEVMSIASLSMGYFSFAVRESVAARVPYLSLDVAGYADRIVFKESQPVYRELSQSGNLFNFSGVTYIMNGQKITHDLPNKSLSDFRMDPKAFEEYYAKYLAVPGVVNSEVFLDVVQSLIERGIYI